MTDDTRSGIEFVKDFAVRLGLTMVETGATADSAPTYSLYYGKSCLLMSSFPMQIESYLWGYRDGRGLPMADAKEAAETLTELSHYARTVEATIEVVRERVLKLKNQLEPLTRERSGV